MRGVGEDEELEWRKLADRLKATKKKENEGDEKNEEEDRISKVQSMVKNDDNGLFP